MGHKKPTLILFHLSVSGQKDEMYQVWKELEKGPNIGNIHVSDNDLKHLIIKVQSIQIQTKYQLTKIIVVKQPTCRSRSKSCQIAIPFELCDKPLWAFHQSLRVYLHQKNILKAYLNLKKYLKDLFAQKRQCKELTCN